jgi:hypothetical protein
VSDVVARQAPALRPSSDKSRRYLPGAAPRNNPRFAERSTRCAKPLSAGARIVILDRAASDNYWRDPLNNVAAPFG